MMIRRLGHVDLPLVPILLMIQNRKHNNNNQHTNPSKYLVAVMSAHTPLVHEEDDETAAPDWGLFWFYPSNYHAKGVCEREREREPKGLIIIPPSCIIYTHH